MSVALTSPIARGYPQLLVHACALFILCTSYRTFHLIDFCVKTHENPCYSKELSVIGLSDFTLLYTFFGEMRARDEGQGKNARPKLYIPLHFLLNGQGQLMMETQLAVFKRLKWLRA